VNDYAEDWTERKTDELLRAARRSGYFADVIADAKWFEREGYTWVVALSMACKYWCS